MATMSIGSKKAWILKLIYRNNLPELVAGGLLLVLVAGGLLVKALDNRSKGPGFQSH